MMIFFIKELSVPTETSLFQELLLPHKLLKTKLIYPCEIYSMFFLFYKEILTEG